MAGDKTRNKALKQAYKLAFPVMGVYAIRNQGNGRLFLDQSSNLTGALNRHRMELRFGTHRNRALQQDWRDFGEAQFSFEILEKTVERAEPDFDYAAERERCLAVWRQRLLDGATAAYN